MNTFIYILILGVAVAIFLSSCEKRENPKNESSEIQKDRAPLVPYKRAARPFSFYISALFCYSLLHTYREVDMRV